MDANTVTARSLIFKQTEHSYQKEQVETNGVSYSYLIELALNFPSALRTLREALARFPILSILELSPVRELCRDNNKIVKEREMECRFPSN